MFRGVKKVFSSSILGFMLHSSATLTSALQTFGSESDRFEGIVEDRGMG
jgi:hypothetical protein